MKHYFRSSDITRSMFRRLFTVALFSALLCLQCTQTFSYMVAEENTETVEVAFETLLAVHHHHFREVKFEQVCTAEKMVFPVCDERLPVSHEGFVPIFLYLRYRSILI
jgi:hypothetical protein